MISYILKNKIDFYVIVSSLLMMLVVLNLPFKAKPFGDDTFHKEAKNLALYIKGEKDYQQVTISKAPGPVVFYTVPYLIAPSKSTDTTLWNYAVVFSFLLITVSMLFIYRVCCYYFSKQVGFLALLLLLLFPIHFYYTLGILAEVPAFFSFSLGLFGWVKIKKQPNSKYAWLCFLAGFSFLILNRPNTILFLPVAIISLWFILKKYRDYFETVSFSKIIISLFSIGLICLSVLMLSKKITGDKVDSKQEELLYYVAHQGRFQFREEPIDLRYWESDVRPDSKDYQNWKKSSRELGELIKTSKKDYKTVYKDFLLNDALQNPFWIARQFFVKIFYGHIYIINSLQPENFKILFLKGKIGYFIFTILVNIINLLILLGVFIFIFNYKKKYKYWPLWSVLVAVLFFHGLTYMEPRYLFPSKVALVILSAAGLYKLRVIRKSTDKLFTFLRM